MDNNIYDYEYTSPEQNNQQNNDVQKNVYQQQQYQYANNNFQPSMDMSPLSLGEWLITLVIGSIPCVGVIVYLVWAFSSNGNINRRNFCRASLIVVGALAVLYIILIFVFGIAAYSTGTVIY